MVTTRLSSKGQVIIPKALRTRHHWETGQELVAVDMGDGVLLRPASPFHATSLHDVAASLPFQGPAKTLEEMEEAVKTGAKRRA